MVRRYLHHEQGKYLVLPLHLASPNGVTVMIVSEHHEATIGADEEETSNTKNVPPDGSETFIIVLNKLDYVTITWQLVKFS